MLQIQLQRIRLEMFVEQITKRFFTLTTRRFLLQIIFVLSLVYQIQNQISVTIFSQLIHLNLHIIEHSEIIFFINQLL